MDKKKKPTRLTDAEEKFIQELLKPGMTQRQAYKNAYPHRAKWKDSVIDSKASDMLHKGKNGKIKERFEELKAKLVKQAEEESIVDAKEILKEIKKIAFANIKDYMSWKTALTVVDTDELTSEPVIDYAPIISLVPSDEVDGAPVQEVSVTSNGKFAFKMHSKIKALEKLLDYVVENGGEEKGRNIELVCDLPVKKYAPKEDDGE